MNEIGRCSVGLARPIYGDPYDRCRDTGSFVLIDSLSNKTVAAGMIIDRLSEQDRKGQQIVERGHVSENIEESLSQISRVEREKRLGGRSKTFWLTGLSGSGKSTISAAFEMELFKSGRSVYRLDGDNLRHGLNRDLGFSDNDRSENIRRTAEVAKILNDVGVTVICSLISPFVSDRKIAKEILGKDNFVEVYISTPLAVCEERDPKGLYVKARKGEIVGFTGVSAPYEESESPACVIDTSQVSLDQAVKILMSI